MMNTVIAIIIIAILILGLAIALHLRQRKIRHQERLDTIASLTPRVEDSFSEISSLFKYSHYITESERLYLEEKYADLANEVRTILKWRELEECPDKEVFQRFLIVANIAVALCKCTV